MIRIYALDTTRHYWYHKSFEWTINRRTILKLVNFVTTSPMLPYDKLKWTNLRTKWKINRCLMVHKCLNSNVPEYLCNHFTRSDHKHSTRTSTSGSVNIPALRTVQGQRSFGYTGSKDFNSLPVNLKSIKEYTYFKRETKEHFRNMWCNEY